MKLRLRSLESKATHRIEVPNPCNLQQLNQILSLQLFPSSSSATVQHNLLFSLNRKDELCGSSPQESLQSLGVTSGDLIYFTENPYAFSSQNPNMFHTQMDNTLESSTRNDHMNAQMFEGAKVDEFVVSTDQAIELGGARMDELSKWRNPDCDSGDLVNTQNVGSSGKDEIVGSSDGKGKLVDDHVKGMSRLSNPDDQMIESGSLELRYALDTRGQELMGTQIGGSSGLNDRDQKSVDVAEGTDAMEVDDKAIVSNMSTRFSVPSFLRKVFVKEVGDATGDGGNHKLLVIAVHAVLLESGFVSYDPISGRKVDGFHLPDEWPSSAFGMSLHYTLPEVAPSEVVETVILKFQILGKYVNVYGSSPKKGFGVYRVCLDEPKFVPALSYVWKNSDNGYAEKERDGSMKLYPNREIFEFWKAVKDGLSYPLLIDLCEHVGLVPPPCFMRLPTELKLKILESLPAVDVARVACVSSELHFVASSNDLWKLKYEEEFGHALDSQIECQWKAKFGTAWEIRNKRKRVCVPLQWREPPHFRPLFPGRRDPNPLGAPFIIGGDYDMYPAIGMPPHTGRRTFRRNCNLGGFGV